MPAVQYLHLHLSPCFRTHPTCQCFVCINAYILLRTKLVFFFSVFLTCYLRLCSSLYILSQFIFTFVLITTSLCMLLFRVFYISNVPVHHPRRSGTVGSALKINKCVKSRPHPGVWKSFFMLLFFRQISAVSWRKLQIFHDRTEN